MSAECPDWCNREHRPGANPNRVSHEHKFRPQDGGSSGVRGPRVINGVRYSNKPAWVTTYPCPSEHHAPAAILRATSYGDTMDMVLTLDDLRRLVSDLSYMADVLEAEQALTDARKIGLSA